MTTARQLRERVGQVAGRPAHRAGIRRSACVRASRPHEVATRARRAVQRPLGPLPMARAAMVERGAGRRARPLPPERSSCWRATRGAGRRQGAASGGARSRRAATMHRPARERSVLPRPGPRLPARTTSPEVPEEGAVERRGQRERPGRSTMLRSAALTATTRSLPNRALWSWNIMDSYPPRPFASRQGFYAKNVERRTCDGAVAMQVTMGKRGSDRSLDDAHRAGSDAPRHSP